MARVVNAEEVNERRGLGFAKPGWSLTSYPFPDPDRVDKRKQMVAEEHMLWRRDHSLACPPGGHFAVEDLPLMMTKTEFEELSKPKTKRKKK